MIAVHLYAAMVLDVMVFIAHPYLFSRQYPGISPGQDLWRNDLVAVLLVDNPDHGATGARRLHRRRARAALRAPVGAPTDVLGGVG